MVIQGNSNGIIRPFPAQQWIERHPVTYTYDQLTNFRTEFIVNGQRIVPFYVLISFPFGVEFSFLPTRQDWRQLWYLIKQKMFHVKQWATIL